MSLNYACTGIAEAITCNQKIFLLEGDRHHWPERVKEDWENQWHKAPYQVITVKDQLVFQGKVYSSIAQAEHILDYCMQKGWVPKFFKEDTKEYNCSIETLKQFFAMLKRFTRLVKDHHYLEMVFGKIDEGPTHDMKIIEATRKREVLEEAGIVTKAEFVRFSEPFGGHVTAVFKSHMDIADMEAAWADMESQRRPTGNEWRCPIPWYKSIFGIDLEWAKFEKALHETRNGRWYPLEIHPLMDQKNKAVIQLF